MSGRATFGPCLRPGEPQCGTASLYNNAKCRGDACYQARREYLLAYHETTMPDFGAARKMLPWIERARCVGHENPAIFFPCRGDYESQIAALAVCHACPVRAECLEYALGANEKFGIWGGTSERQRRAMRSRRWSERRAVA